MFPPVIPHLNVHGLVIQATPEKGRGVFGEDLPSCRGVVELNRSPDVLFYCQQRAGSKREP